jgi:hypothetical protein
MSATRATVARAIGLMFAVAAVASASAQEPKTKTNWSSFDISKLQMVPWTSTATTIEKIDGYYTYKAKDALVEELGVKVVSPLDVPLAEGMVQFRPCGEKVKKAVDHKLLHHTTRTCVQGGGFWLRKYGDALVPALNSAGAVKALAGKKIDLSSFPYDYQEILRGAKNGALVGYSAKVETGDHTLSLFSKQQM